MKAIKTAVLITILGTVMAFIQGCGTTGMTSDFDNETDFTTFKTYDWLTNKKSGSNDAVFRNAIVDKRFRRSINDELDIKGYQQNAESPDFYVAYFANIENKEYRSCSYFGHFSHDYHHGHRRYHDRHIGFGFPLYMDCSSDSYKEAALIVDVIDASTSELVWRGWSSAATPGPSISENTIRKAITKIFENFPPEQY